MPKTIRYSVNYFIPGKTYSEGDPGHFVEFGCKAHFCAVGNQRFITAIMMADNLVHDKFGEEPIISGVKQIPGNTEEIVFK